MKRLALLAAIAGMVPATDLGHHGMVRTIPPKKNGGRPMFKQNRRVQMKKGRRHV